MRVWASCIARGRVSVEYPLASPPLADHFQPRRMERRPKSCSKASCEGWSSDQTTLSPLFKLILSSSCMRAGGFEPPTSGSEPDMLPPCYTTPSEDCIICTHYLDCQCGKQGSNLHARRHQDLNLVCLPIPPFPQSLRQDSNPRHLGTNQKLSPLSYGGIIDTRRPCERAVCDEVHVKVGDRLLVCASVDYGTEVLQALLLGDDRADP